MDPGLFKAALLPGLSSFDIDYMKGTSGPIFRSVRFLQAKRKHGDMTFVCVVSSEPSQKFGETLCSAHIIRASRVVIYGLSLIFTSLEAPALSLRTRGDAPCIRDSLGNRYRSPVPTST